MNKNSGYKVHWMMDSHEYGRLESVDTHPGDVQPGNGLYIWALILVVKAQYLGLSVSVSEAWYKYLENM